MQLFAVDDGGDVVSAVRAVKHKNYSCMECRQVVRLRSGIHRQRHFYHLQPDQSCRLNAKSMVHLMLQYYVQSLLPPDDALLEHRFDSINRIADVAWLSRKIVFEVQCSQITAQEVEERNADYASAGFQTVWLLHDSRYNQQCISGAEDVLRCWPHYFTDMDSNGEGSIYDQFSFFSGGLRKGRLPRLVVDLSQPCSVLEQSNHYKSGPLPKFIVERMGRWPIHFRGDSIDACFGPGCQGHLKDFFEAEEKHAIGEEVIWELPVWEFIKRACSRWVAYPYRSVLRLFLERASR